MLHGEKEFTAAGNPKGPPMLEYLNWIADAWDKLPEETITNSFKICGINSASDGSEDDKIHCFKAKGPIPTGEELLKKARKEDDFEELIELVDEIDLAQDEENGIMSDASLEL
jgi:hypothetical protein